MRKAVSSLRRPAVATARGITPFFSEGGIALYHGDCLDILPGLQEAEADALITDPPYSSGGTTAAERARDPVEKYCQDGNARGRPSFAGDTRDQRSFLLWGSLWGLLARRACKPGAYGLVFSDWRQVPTMSDLLQAAGFTWRGMIAWDKGRGARAPHKGYFRHQCEYVVWGTNGRCELADDGPWDGCLHQSVKKADKFHVTGKPTDLMRQLVRCVPPGGLVLDPFGGSCTTGVACALTGRRCILIEQSIEYCRIGADRLRQALASRSQAAA